MKAITKKTIITVLFALLGSALSSCEGGSSGDTLEEVLSPFLNSVIIDEDNPAAINLQDYHVEIEGNLIYSISKSPEHGTLEGTFPEIIYTPQENYYGEDSFTFRVTTDTGRIDFNSDDLILPLEQSVPISILPVNDPPVVEAEGTTIFLTSFLGKVCPLAVQSVKINLSGSDVEEEDLSYSISEEAKNGSAEINDSILTYTPNPWFLGTDEVGVIAHDGTDDSATIKVSISVKSLESNLSDSPTLYDQGFILQATAGTFTDFHGVNSPAVIYVPQEKKYVMYFETRFEGPLKDPNCTLARDWGLGRAESSDLLNWELTPQPTITPGDHSDYACAAAHSAALYDGELYHLWFKMHPADGAQEGLGYATSTDGIDFTYKGKIASGIKSYPTAVRVNGIIFVYFYVPDGSFPSSKIGMIYSEDNGETWLPDEDNDGDPEANDVLFPGGPWSVGTQWELWKDQLVHPSALCNPNGGDDSFELFITSRERKTSHPFTIFNEVWGVLTSEDEEDFAATPDFEPFLNPADGIHQKVLKYGKNYFVFYGTEDGDGKKGIKLMTTLENWPVE